MNAICYVPFLYIKDWARKCPRIEPVFDISINSVRTDLHNAGPEIQLYLYRRRKNGCD
jgi:hypothetical protein